MRRFVTILSLLLLVSACSDRNTAEHVAEDFVYNYYQHANQDVALLLSDALAADKLKDEIERLRTVRNPTEQPHEMPSIKYKMMGKKIEGENQVFFRYRLTIKSSGLDTPLRNVVIQTELIDKQWKVINFDEYGD